MRENIAYGRPDASQAEIEEAARRAQAHDFVARLPEGYDTVIGERGLTLSGGQRQRIAIARALSPIRDPDPGDATASVDATTEARIRLALREAMAGRTTLIIAHRLSTISLADEIWWSTTAASSARGTHDEIVGDSPGVRRDLGPRRDRPDFDGLDRDHGGEGLVGRSQGLVSRGRLVGGATAPQLALLRLVPPYRLGAVLASSACSSASAQASRAPP